MLYFYIVCQKLSRLPEKSQTTNTGVVTLRLKTTGLKAHVRETKTPLVFKARGNLRERV